MNYYHVSAVLDPSKNEYMKNVEPGQYASERDEKFVLYCMQLDVNVNVPLLVFKSS